MREVRRRGAMGKRKLEEELEQELRVQLGDLENPD